MAEGGKVTSIDDARRQNTGGSARVPPHNLQAEESLLGAMLLSREAVAVAAESVRSEDFYKPAHGHVFDAILSLYSQGEPVDAATVGDQIQRAGLRDAIGGPATLISLMANTPATSNAPRYATIVTEHAMLRRLIGVAGEIAELGYATPEDVAAVVDKAEGLVFDVGGRHRRAAVSQLGETLGGWLDRLEARYERGELSGTPTGFIDLDELLLGLHGGQLISVAGRPGMGKSAWAGALAVNVATAGQAVLFVSVEMSLEELQDRFVAQTAEVPLQSLRSGRIVEKDWPRVSFGIGHLSDIPLYVDDDAGATLLSIRSTARRLAARHQGLGVVIVDYVQLMAPVHKGENRQVEVAELSRGLKRLALELKVPVVALAQLNRNLEMRADKRPMLSDLRESGAIENDSDVVVFLFRDEVYKPDSDDKGVMELIVAKQRNGPTGVVKLAYEATRGTFKNMTSMRQEGF